MDAQNIHLVHSDARTTTSRHSRGVAAMRDEHEMVKDPPGPYVGVGVGMFDGNQLREGTLDELELAFPGCSAAALQRERCSEAPAHSGGRGAWRPLGKYSCKLSVDVN